MLEAAARITQLILAVPIANEHCIVKIIKVYVIRMTRFSSRLYQSAHNQDGFSLIELVIVLLIIGFLSSMVIINIGNNFNRELRSEAERFQKIVIAGSDEAIFSSSEIGVIFQQNGYQLLRFNAALNLWEPYSNGTFEAYRLPETMSLVWSVEGYRRHAETDIVAPDDLFSNLQSYGESDSQSELNKILLDQIDDPDNNLTGVLLEGLDLTPELLLSSSGELPVFEVLFSAAKGVENPALIRVSSDGFSMPSVTDLTQSLVSEEQLFNES